MSAPDSRARALIAEDEPVLRADLQARVAALWPELRVVGAASNGIEALAMAARHAPHILFLDIEMPGMDGLEVARQLSATCHIVFITAYDAHAIAAFDAGAVDYVLKPYEDARLSQALRRVQERLTCEPPSMEELLQQLALSSKPREYLRWIKASRGSEVDLILVQEVAFFQAEAKYTTVFTERRESIIRRSIKELAGELDPNAFWQIHRSTIVNVEPSSRSARAGRRQPQAAQPPRAPAGERGLPAPLQAYVGGSFDEGDGPVDRLCSSTPSWS